MGGGQVPAWSSRLVIQLVRGLPGTLHVHRGTVAALGLRRRHQTVFRENNPSIRGMINQVCVCVFFFFSKIPLLLSVNIDSSIGLSSSSSLSSCSPVASCFG
jgi:large subunit ribosomal protein L30